MVFLFLYGLRGLCERPVSAFCLSVALRKWMLIPKLQLLSFSGIENQEKTKPEARKSRNHRVTIFNLVCFCWRIVCRIRTKTLTCTKRIFVRGVSSILLVCFCASIEKNPPHLHLKMNGYHWCYFTLKVNIIFECYPLTKVNIISYSLVFYFFYKFYFSRWC